MMRALVLLAVAGLGALTLGCSAPATAPETTAAPQADSAATATSLALLASVGSFAMTPVEPADGAPLTVTRSVDEAGMAEGQDPHVMLRLEASATQFVVLHEANHAPFDVMAQSAGGVLATAIGAPAGTAPLFYRVEQSEGAPLMCGPQGPVSMALYEDANGALVITGLTVATFEGLEGETGITLAPLPAAAVCGRAVYQRAA